jgi:hypothetical protein
MFWLSAVNEKQKKTSATARRSPTSSAYAVDMFIAIAASGASFNHRAGS